MCKELGRVEQRQPSFIQSIIVRIMCNTVRAKMLIGIIVNRFYAGLKNIL